MDLIEQDFRRYLCQTSDEPVGLIVSRAEGCRIIDSTGKEYLDFLSGIGVANIGHSHPAVVRAAKEQVEKYLHVMVYGEYIQAPQVELVRLLSRVVPPPLSVTYLTNSGAEAVDGALKTAIKYTERHGIISFEGAYHGGTIGAFSLIGNTLHRKPFDPLLPGVRILPFNQKKALSAVDQNIAAVIIEPIQGEGGVRVPDDDFLPALRERCSKVGALLIFDEVMTGFGRTGKMFACQHWGVVPDLLVMAKAMGGGMPLGGFIGKPEIMQTLASSPPFTHLTTFGGHPVSCAAGCAGLKILLDQNLSERAIHLGHQLIEGLQRLAPREKIRAIRGKGLLIGMELDTPDLAHRFVRLCREEGLLVGSTLHRNMVIRLAPPLIITESEIQRGIEIMKKALEKAAAPTR